jgi:hypothetical protein
MSKRGTTTATILLSVLLYVGGMASLFSDPKCRDVSVAAFGERPFAIPWHLFLFLLLTLLFIPFPFIFWYHLYVNLYAKQQGHRIFGVIGFFRYLLLEFDHEKASTYRARIFLGYLFYFVIAVSWIIYTEVLGI